MPEHLDVLIVGAGLSGIGAASHLKRECPEKSFAIVESRSVVGGTWDLFRYPGVRSDSDMYTLGYSFRPWSDAQAIADGDSIRTYIGETIAHEKLEPHLRLNHRVVKADWSSELARWSVTAVRTAEGEYRTGAPVSETVTFTCSFLFVCSGYYRYDEGFTPAIDGAETFTGPVVHPQHWPADLDYGGKRVVIIGSGATAVTLVPAMAKTAGHVTMLQRSPTYVAPVPSRDSLADRLRGRLPAQLAYNIVRVKNIAYSMFTYQLSRKHPGTMKAILRQAAASRLPSDFDIDAHLSPAYNPWDQRLCAIPDGDLYRAISSGTAEIVTDRIERVTPTGIDLASGAKLPADIIVTATGLNLLFGGGMTLSVDGRPVELAQTLAYKGMMLADVPNFAVTIGYTNASWTLKADLVARYVCRLLKHMDRHGYQTATPAAPASIARGELVSLIDLQAGYVLRSVGGLPKQGAKAPWRLHQNYVRDFRLLRAGRVTDDMRFGQAGLPPSAEDPMGLPGTAMVTVDGTRLRYRTTGQGDPVLLLHGIGQSLDDWSEQHDRLSANHTVYSLDLPGFAYSDRLPGTTTLLHVAGIIPAFLDAVGATGPVTVVGNSLGGAVAMAAAVEHPEHVSSLVLVNSAGFGKEVAVALRLLAIKPVGSVLMRPKLKNSARVVRSIFADTSFATDARIAHAFALAQRPAHAATMLELAAELGTFRGISEERRTPLVSELAKLGIPTLVMWGDHDRVLPFRHFTAAAAAFPVAETHVFAGAGHMPQIERADEFAAVVEGFLRRQHQGARAAHSQGAGS